MLDIGWGRAEIGIEPRGYSMNGYGMPGHRAVAARTPLFARTVMISDGSSAPAIVSCLDMAMVNHSMRAGAAAELATRLGDVFDDARFVLTCTHTHSSPGGCGYEALYNFVTPGFQPDHLAAVISAVVESVDIARAGMAPSTLSTRRVTLPPTDQVAWNRSLAAYNQNPEVVDLHTTQAHLGLDREMVVLDVRRDGELRAMVSLFGVHATCLGNDLDAHDGDNKGYASTFVERRLSDAGHADAVAIFAQSTAGDVSPHYHGPGQRQRRKEVRARGDHVYARANGELQGRRALEADAADQHGIAARPPVSVDGVIDALMTYVDFTEIDVDPDHIGGVRGARTSDPCHGAAFFAGTPVDGPGAPGAVGVVARLLARSLRRARLGRSANEPDGADGYYPALYASQGAKDIVLEAGRKLTLGRPLAKTLLPDVVDPLVAQMKREARDGALDRSPLVPTVLPIQILRVGDLALVCCPGEVTTIAGRRLCDTVRVRLAGSGVTDVLLVTYCNDYMGYVTTAEEYAEQRYEGGHTIFGQWTLGAFQTEFARLADQLVVEPDQRSLDRSLRPAEVPADELARRSSHAPRS